MGWLKTTMVAPQEFSVDAAASVISELGSIFI